MRGLQQLSATSNLKTSLCLTRKSLAVLETMSTAVILLSSGLHLDTRRFREMRIYLTFFTFYLFLRLSVLFRLLSETGFNQSYVCCALILLSDYEKRLLPSILYRPRPVSPIHLSFLFLAKRLQSPFKANLLHHRPALHRQSQLPILFLFL